MKIKQIHMKPSHGAPMERVVEARARAAHGIIGDINACAFSPRQVLVVNAKIVEELQLNDADLRGNLIVDADVDHLESGTILRIGRGVRLRLTMPCEPCSKLEQVRHGLVREVHERRGALARVLTSGRIREGMAVTVERRSLRPLADDWQVRIRDIVGKVPYGAVVTYARLAKIAGLQSSYCRAFPGALRRSSPDLVLPKHRVIPANIERVTDDHRSSLNREGVSLADWRAHLWSGEPYYRVEESAMFGKKYA